MFLHLCVFSVTGPCGRLITAHVLRLGGGDEYSRGLYMPASQNTGNTVKKDTVSKENIRFSKINSYN